MHYFSLKTSVSLTIIFTILFTTSCQKSRKEQIEYVRNSVVHLEVHSKNGKKLKDSGGGTGFFISNNLIATAFHVSKAMGKDIEGIESLQIVCTKFSYLDNNSFIIPVKLEITDEENDLAIYSFNPIELRQQWESFTVTPLQISDKLPDIGDEVMLVGFFSPYSYPLSSIGTVSMITEDRYTPAYSKDNVIFNNAIFSDLTSLPGHSGGPLYSFETQIAVGINVRILNPNDDSVRNAISTNSTHLIALMSVLKVRQTEQQNQPANQANAQSN